MAALCPFCCVYGGDLLLHYEAGCAIAVGLGDRNVDPCPEARRWWALQEELAWLIAHGVPVVRKPMRENEGYQADGRSQAYFPRWLRWVLEGAHESLARGYTDTVGTSWLLAPSMRASRSAVITAQADPAFRKTLWAAWRLGHGTAVGAFMRAWDEEHGANLPR